MIKITMGQMTLGKIWRFFIKKAVLVTVLFLIVGGYLGVSFWNSRLSTDTVAEAAPNPEQVFTKVSVDRQWVLLGEEFTFKQKSLPFRVELSPEFADISLNYMVSGTDLQGRMIRDGTGRYWAEIFVGNLKPGKYTVFAQIESGSGTVASPKAEFQVSYPLYVAWTLDWEGEIIPDKNLAAIDAIANNHKIPITHFFNPRIYISPATTSPARADYLTSWVIKRKRTRGDAIGLHLHMFYDMVKAAGVEPRHSPDRGGRIDDGSDILISGYTYEETVKILNWSKNLFEEEGLGTPNMFRAGGWYADEETLKALDDTGFVADSSGRTKYFTGTKAIKGPWDLAETTQPYHPNIYNQNSSEYPTLGLWEFPNNGADSYAFSESELYSRFTANFKGSPLSKRTIVTYLSHPEYFWVDDLKLKTLFTRIDKHLNSLDGGPVIYVTLEEAYRIWAENGY